MAIKHGHNIRMNDQRGEAAFAALGELIGTAKSHGCDAALLAELERRIAPVLHRGANYSYRRSRTMQRRAASFPRDARGHFVKRTAAPELPF